MWCDVCDTNPNWDAINFDEESYVGAAQVSTETKSESVPVADEAAGTSEVSGSTSFYSESYSSSMVSMTSFSSSMSYVTYEGEMPEMPEGSTTYESFEGLDQLPPEI